MTRVVVQLRLTVEEKLEWERRCRLAKKTLSEWMRDELNGVGYNREEESILISCEADVLDDEQVVNEKPVAPSVSHSAPCGHVLCARCARDLRVGRRRMDDCPDCEGV